MSLSLVAVLTWLWKCKKRKISWNLKEYFSITSLFFLIFYKFCVKNETIGNISSNFYIPYAWWFEQLEKMGFNKRFFSHFRVESECYSSQLWFYCQIRFRRLGRQFIFTSSLCCIFERLLCINCCIFLTA